MSNKEIIEAIELWQAAGNGPELKCGRNPDHPLLEVREIEEHIILTCSKCSYAQETIPKEVIDYYLTVKEAA
jgi:hypothetical protein